MLKTVFGAVAPKKTIILITKAEALLDDSKMAIHKKAVILARMEEYK